ncbi:hypothetical protein ACH4TE_11965 [Streptomyces sioyaensis]|uniref:hypothetical protein n=1 Tax=Streptomyces sioyaensis TaxID=67364 RepID=UPI003789DFB4
MGERTRRREDPSLARRTTEQQRACELQRTERAQGKHISYHDALNWVHATAEAQAEYPGHTVVFAPHASIMIFHPEGDPKFIRTSITPPTAAEVELSNVLFQRKQALLRNHCKAQFAGIIRRTSTVSSADIARCTKEELTADLVHDEDMHERYEAYGRVPLINGRPARDSRPLCGGIGCSGHNSATPWPGTRARFRAQSPCIDSP